MKTDVVFLIIDGEGYKKYKYLTYNIEEIFIRPNNKKAGFVKITKDDMTMEVIDNSPISSHESS